MPMTEEEWLACEDIDRMTSFVENRPVKRRRKLRLLAVAYCWRVAHLMTDERSRLAVEVAERFADDTATRSELATRCSAARVAIAHTDAESSAYFAARCAVNERITPAHTLTHTASAVGSAALWAASAVRCEVNRQTNSEADSKAAEDAERCAQISLLRDIFGNPFRPSPPLPPAVLAWNDGTIPRIAQAIYEERRMPEGTFDTARLAILADALLDAGCEDEALIKHCREPGPHVRGCWAVDLILGKG
jgi:hypothetical protein